MQSIVKMNEELKIRLFYVLSITAIVANTIGFISNCYYLWFYAYNNIYFSLCNYYVYCGNYGNVY